MDAVASDDEIEMDMTTASDDDVIAVYKKLTGDDEIEVVVDDEAGEVKLTVNEPGEFVIKMDDVEGGDVDLGDVDDIGGDVEADVEIDDLEIDPVGDSLDGEVDGPVEDADDEVIYEIGLEEDLSLIHI